MATSQTSANNPRRSQSRRSSAAFSRILDVAVRQIAEHGIQDVRLAQVAEEAGVSVSLIHYHFATREVLLEEALTHAYTQADRDRELWERAQTRLTHAQRLANMLDRILPGSAQHSIDEWRLWVELWLQAIRNPDLRPVAGDLYAGWRRWWIDALQAGIAAGEFTDCDVSTVADRILALVDGYGIRGQIDPTTSIGWARAEMASYVSGTLGVPIELSARA